jgi:hypothetical protein
VSRQMCADILSLITRLRAPPAAAYVCGHPLADRPAAGTAFPGRSGAGVRCEATREEVCLDGGSTALQGTQSRISPCSGRLSERSWPYDCGNIRRMTVQLGFALLSPCVRAVVFSTRMVEGGR